MAGSTPRASRRSAKRPAGNAVAAAQEAHHPVPMTGTRAGDVGPDLRGEERELVPRQQVSGESETENEEEQEHARDPRQLARRPVRLHEEDADQMEEAKKTIRFADQEWIERISQPNGTTVMMNSTDSNASFGRRPVVQHQQHAGADLHEEKEQRHSAEVVEDAVAVQRGRSCARQTQSARETEAVVEPASGADDHLRLYAFETTILARLGSFRDS